MPKNESTAINDLIHLVQGKIVEGPAGDDNLFVTAPPRMPGMPPALPRKRAPAATPAPAIQEAISQMPRADYVDESATEIDGPHIAQQRKWLDSIETIPFDPSMRVNDLGEGTPPRAVAPIRVDAPRTRQPTRPQGTPRPATQRPATQSTPRPPVRHPHDHHITRAMHVDVAGGHVSFSPDPDAIAPAPAPDPRALPLVALPTPYPVSMALPIHAPYGAPALPPHAPTAMALPPQAIMPTQIAQPLPAMMPTQVAQQYMRPVTDGVTPYPVPPWAGAPHIGAPLQHGAQYPQPHGYMLPTNDLSIYDDTSEDQRAIDTGRVPQYSPGQSVPSLRPSIGRYALPLGGAIAITIFVAGYFFVRGGDTSAKVATATAPVVMATTAPVVTPPVVTAIEPQLPDPSWKERAPEPTIVAAAPIVEEIEMAPAPVAKKKVTTASSSARRAKQRVAIIELPKVEKKAAKPAKAEKPTKAKVATSAKAERDPILEEIERPTKSEVKATGPGKLAISTSIPTLIYVDGRSTNLMTPKTLNLAPGTHKITLLELKSRKAKTIDIDVASGKLTKLDKKF